MENQRVRIDLKSFDRSLLSEDWNDMWQYFNARSNGNLYQVFIIFAFYANYLHKIGNGPFLSGDLLEVLSDKYVTPEDLMELFYCEDIHKIIGIGIKYNNKNRKI